MKKVLTVLAVIIVVGLIGGGVVEYLRTTDQVDTPDILPDDSPDDETEAAQPDWCPRVEVISAPGTWESAPDDDPFNPQANPHSFMLNITNPLQQRYAPEDVRVWTLPYAAQFRNINADHERSYDDSRQEGTLRLRDELQEIHRECPLTDFVLAGFSQGAVIAGDIAASIGNGHGEVPAERVRGVALIADGRRSEDQGQTPGVPVEGVGAEIALEPLEPLVQAVTPGASMRGPREGFGALDDRTFQICAPNDTICDAPRRIGNAVGRAMDLVQANGVHAQYAQNQNVIPGTTADAWVTQWIIDLIDQP